MFDLIACVWLLLGEVMGNDARGPFLRLHCLGICPLNLDRYRMDAFQNSPGPGILVLVFADLTKRKVLIAAHFVDGGLRLVAQPHIYFCCQVSRRDCLPTDKDPPTHLCLGMQQDVEADSGGCRCFSSHTVYLVRY